MISGISVYGLSFRYPGSTTDVLSGVSLELDRGKVIALLGPNGCGKSTLLKIFAGITPGQHKVRISGGLLSELPAWRRAQRIAYVAPEFRSEFPMTAFEAVLLGRICQSAHAAALWGRKQEDEHAVIAAMTRTGCLGLRHRELQSLSGGERQLVALARALVQGAKILLLDEALSRMDLHHQALCGKLLRELVSEGFLIIVVAHDLNLACEWADECVVLLGGKLLAQGSVSETLTPERLRVLYPGAQLVISPSPATGVPKVFFGNTPEA